MSLTTKITVVLVLLEAACVAIVHSPLRAHVAAVAGQSAISGGTSIGVHASPLVATLVIAAQMAAATVLPFGIIACILHACILQGAKSLDRVSKELEKSRRLTDD